MNRLAILLGRVAALPQGAAMKATERAPNVLGEMAIAEDSRRLLVWNGERWLDMYSREQRIIEAVGLLTDCVERMGFPSNDPTPGGREALARIRDLLAETRR